MADMLACQLASMFAGILVDSPKTGSIIGLDFALNERS